MITGLGVALAAPRVARAAARKARFGHNSTDASPFGRGMAAFAAAVAADPVLSETITIDVVGSARLGDDLSMLKGCLGGTIEGAFVGASAISNFVTEIGLLNAPYLFRDVTHARAVLDGEVGKQLMELAHAKNFTIMAWGENGLRHITSNTPIRNPADLRGLKIRVPQSEVMLGGFRAMGAVASPLPVPLLREALRTGDFQAQENPITIIEALKLYEFQKCCSLTGHIIDPLGLIVSNDLLEDLSEPQRVALAAAAQAASKVSRSVSDAASRDGIERLKGQGMTVIEDVDLAAFRAAARPYLDGLGPVYGAARVQTIINATS